MRGIGELRSRMAASKRILLSPLDWGMGHATRCVPIIRQLEAWGAEVVLASTGRGRKFLEAAFPHLEHLDVPAYGITYSGKSVVLDITFQVPGMLKTIQEERLWLYELLNGRHFDGVISDNRYGLDAHPHSVLITHQLMPLVPTAVNRWVKRKLNSIYNEFEAVWVPDFSGPNALAGRLSAPKHAPEHVQFIGPLSRFEAPAPARERDVDWLVLLSGPEGQRRKSEEAVLEKFDRTEGRVVLLRGLPGTRTCLPSHIESVAHPTDVEFVEWVARSKNILATAGYSTIMDLVALGRSAWLMPTPGQYEQEYLGDYLEAKGWFKQIRRKHLHRTALTPLAQEAPHIQPNNTWLRAWYDTL